MKIDNSVLFLLGGVGAATATSQYPLYYDTTWAGPVRFADNFNLSANSTGFTMVEATLVMPHLSIPTEPHTKVEQYTASFWIGLDGFLSSEVIRGLWQAGVIMSVWPNGTTQYTGFHEWIPNDPIDVDPSELGISEGHHIHVILKTTNNGYHGSTTLTNLNTSQTYTHSQDATEKWRGPTWPAQGATAEWIIEAGTYLNGPQYVFPDWGNASFLDARACYQNGECSLPGDGGKDQGRITAVLWNDTKTLYTRSHSKGDHVLIRDDLSKDFRGVADNRMKPIGASNSEFSFKAMLYDNETPIISQSSGGSIFQITLGNDTWSNRHFKRISKIQPWSSGGQEPPDLSEHGREPLCNWDLVSELAELCGKTILSKFNKRPIPESETLRAKFDWRRKHDAL
ncbi:hypothetical protein F66182_6945 [Fusarium sp. NRRL 66182]|nr:hypothetical protein F66182_6945 [Fusarium sp. NRRL 66182]